MTVIAHAAPVAHNLFTASFQKKPDSMMMESLIINATATAEAGMLALFGIGHSARVLLDATPDRTR